MKKIYILLLFPYLCLAQIPNFYSSIDFTQPGEHLREELSTLITNTHTTQLVYTSGSSGLLDTWTVLKQSDLNPTNSNNVMLIYGWNDNSTTTSEHYTRGKDLSCHTSSCAGKWVREHVFAKSLATPDLGTEFAGADAHNLRAIDAQRNNTRSNRKFGDASSSIASYSINTNTWYPGDEWRGDVARIIMYMYLRYPTQCAATSLSDSPTTNAPLNDMPDLFLEWNRLDPPSAFEINRNNVIANNQGNRNPFIDNPYIATMIWNGTVAPDSWGVLSIAENNQISNLNVYPTHTSNYIYFTNITDNYKIQVFNLLGQNISIAQNFDNLDFSNQPTGMYLIKFYNNTGSKTFKVFKK